MEGISYTLAKRIANAAGSKLTMDPPLRAGFPSLCLAPLARSLFNAGGGSIYVFN
jgi:hypothetical protein